VGTRSLGSPQCGEVPTGSRRDPLGDGDAHFCRYGLRSSASRGGSSAAARPRLDRAVAHRPRPLPGGGPVAARRHARGIRTRKRSCFRRQADPWRVRVPGRASRDDIGNRGSSCGAGCRHRLRIQAVRPRRRHVGLHRRARHPVGGLARGHQLRRRSLAPSHLSHRGPGADGWAHRPALVRVAGRPC